MDHSFSSTDKPQVRLDYTTTQKPLLLRVLRPQNLERFLDGQLHISRSYEAPLSELNPGYYFITGLNQLESPLRTFRGMLDSDFRKSLQGTSLHQALLETTRGDMASRPEQVIHGPPSGFMVVREYYIDLEFGGKDADDLGWWFGNATWTEEDYKTRRITLDPLPDGVYLVQAVQGKAEAQCLLQVSSLSVQVKQSSEQLVVRVIDRAMDPVAGASLSYRDGRGTWIPVPQTTNAFGETVFSNPDGILDGKLVIKVETPDKRQALVDTDFLPTTVKDDSVFIVTDRPIFKPGESFFYKGVVRAMENGGLKVPSLAEKEAKVTLIRTDGTPTDLQAVVPLTEFASFSGGFDLDELQVPGLYRLVAEIAHKPYGGELRVRDYVKPTFYLELMDRSPTVVAGEPFFVKFRAKRFAGGVPRGVKFEVFLYRKKFETPQFVVEAGGGLSAGTDYHGEIRSAGSLTEPRRIFSSVEQRMAALGDLYAPNPWDSAPQLDESGEAEFQLTVPKAATESEEEWLYSLMVRAMDASGSHAVVTDSIFATLSEAHAAIQFSEPVTQVGDKGQTIHVRSTFPGGKPAPAGGGVVDIMLEQSGTGKKALAKLPFSTDAQGACKVPLPELTGQGRLTAVATLETLDGKPMKHKATSQPVWMIVGGAQGEAVVDNSDLELFTAGTVLSPGEKARIFALLPAHWGKGETGTIWETIAGSKVHETKASEAKGRSRWLEVEAKPEYGTGFYHTVTVPMGGGKYREQTLGFRIVPWTKRLKIDVRPEGKITEPLEPFKIDFEVKDADGKPAADTELAVTIVDRAVYAVQSEMRPGIFDFFYPLPRLNLATFYSDDLQGYGYADILKKPNFKLGALKSPSKLVKKSMRDTAGWFPHVVTDAQGRASITVDMPANVTEWLITAIATDKNGRMGEAQGGFRSVADVSVEVLAPQFLRQGEEAAVQVRTINHLATDVAVTSDTGLSGEAAIRSGERRCEFTLEKHGEHLSPLVIQTWGDKGAAILKVGLSTEAKIHVGGAEEFEIPLEPSTMRRIFAAAQDKDKLTAPLPDAGDIAEVKIQVSSGLLGAALNAAATLVTYPYGCTEQLVHGTIPNLVLMDLVKRAGIGSDDLGSLGPVLTRAEKNAALGIRKIIRNQKTDGGFGFWASDPAPSLPATLTALYALEIARDLNIEGVGTALDKGMLWLENVKPETLSPEGMLRGFELSRFAEIGSYEQPWKQQIAYVEGLKGQEDAPVSDLIHALKLFSAHKEKSWSRFNEAFKDTGIQEELIGRLQKALEAFDAQAYLTGVQNDARLQTALGFGFQVPYVISAGMGALNDLQVLSPELEKKLVQVLLASQRNGYWISTFDSAQVIFNTRSILSREAETFAREGPSQKRRIVVHKMDGTALKELQRIPSGFAGKLEGPAGTSDGTWEVKLDGVLETDRVTAAVAVDVPFDKVEPRSQGLRVERTFYRVTAAGKEPMDFSRPLHKGDVVVSEVQVKREAPTGMYRLPSSFLVVEDGVPSLAQSIDEDEAILADAGIQAKTDDYWGSIKETRRHPGKTERIAQVAPGGELRIYQVWRVAFTGHASIPPARAFDMYDESLRGSTDAKIFRTE